MIDYNIITLSEEPLAFLRLRKAWPDKTLCYKIIKEHEDYDLLIISYNYKPSIITCDFNFRRIVMTISESNEIISINIG